MKVELTGEEYKELIEKYDNLCELVADSVKTSGHSNEYVCKIYNIIIPERKLDEKIIKILEKRNL